MRENDTSLAALALLYANGEMQGAESAAFEARLATDQGARDIKVFCSEDEYRRFKAACALADVGMSKKLQEYMSAFIGEILGPATATRVATADCRERA